MNYLAHAYLSFNKPEIIVGNMISDFVKGKKQYDFDIKIQNGITLHRLIDTYTDEHETTKQAKQFFKESVGLYAGAFVDVAYDHFLAVDRNEFLNDDALLNFSKSVYSVLNNYQNIFPEKFARMYPYMKQDNWLYNYRTLTGIQKSFGGLVHRAKYLNSSTNVFNAFEENYNSLKEIYSSFFPQLKSFVKNNIAN